MKKYPLQTLFDGIISELEKKGIKCPFQPETKELKRRTVRVNQAVIEDVKALLQKYLGKPALQPGQDMDLIDQAYNIAIKKLPAHFRWPDQPLYAKAASPEYIFVVLAPFAEGATLNFYYVIAR